MNESHLLLFKLPKYTVKYNSFRKGWVNRIHTTTYVIDNDTKYNANVRNMWLILYILLSYTYI